MTARPLIRSRSLASDGARAFQMTAQLNICENDIDVLVARQIKTLLGRSAASRTFQPLLRNSSTMSMQISISSSTTSAISVPGARIAASLRGFSFSNGIAGATPSRDVSSKADRQGRRDLYRQHAALNLPRAAVHNSMTSTLAKTPPVGPEWIHEVKFDGWRVQVHVEGSQATLYSKNGADFTLRPTIASVPVKSAIIDCELVACDETGMPCFKTLTDLANKAPALCLWCFDLLHLNSVRISAAARRSQSTREISTLLPHCCTPARE